MDVAFNSLDNINSFFEDAKVMIDQIVDVESEKKQASTYYEELLNLQLEMEGLPLANTGNKTIVRLTGLDPPSWNGIKADLYTWKREFIHIMEEARITDELT